MPTVAITTALQVIAELIPLIQAAQKSGQPISQADFDAAVGARDAALNKLDSDIAAR